MARQLVAAAVLVLAASAPGSARSAEAQPLADDPLLEARVMQVAGELRCLVCQNESIAASQSALAQDLRKQILHMLSAGRSPEDVRAFMVERYGDFVLYRPALDFRTALLWFGPFALLGGGLAGLGVAIRRRRREAPAPALSDSDRLRVQRLLEEGAGRG
jgi:cytochrome c-type biogenesis protein CcmH